MKTRTLEQRRVDFFANMKEHYGLNLPEKEQESFLIEAGKHVTDLRWVHLLHPDSEMVKTSCLHFLGDEAQIWWHNRNKALKPLSELHKDEDACRRIRAVSIKSEDGFEIMRNEEIGYTEITDGTDTDSISIWDTGHIETIGLKYYMAVPAFQLVDLIRSLGYEPKPVEG